MTPLNAASRGGVRFIFHSALLAEALTAAVAEALPPAAGEGFSHVNPVFRCNRFEPGDANFHRHRDTPYFDAARRHVSRYTVLLYLTGGTGSPALDLGGGAAFDRIDAFTCVIFDQRREHEGAPFDDGRKVFLRTELVFAADGIIESPQIGALFGKACYLTGESVFAPELARQADDYFNRVAAAHWHGLGAGPARETFVHKEFRGVHFVANGYDFWFPRTDALSLAECAALTLLDYFNCKVGDTAFRALCRTAVIEADDADWIPAFLREQGSGSATTSVDKAAFFPEPEQPDGDICCPFHSSDVYDPTRHDEIIKVYTGAQSFAKAHILPAPILMLGEEVALDPEQFVVQDGRIHVLGRDALAPVNFAACWNDGSQPRRLRDRRGQGRRRAFSRATDPLHGAGRPPAPPVRLLPQLLDGRPPAGDGPGPADHRSAVGRRGRERPVVACGGPVPGRRAASAAGPGRRGRRGRRGGRGRGLTRRAADGVRASDRGPTSFNSPARAIRARTAPRAASPSPVMASTRPFIHLDTSSLRRHPPARHHRGAFHDHRRPRGLSAVSATRPIRPRCLAGEWLDLPVGLFSTVMAFAAPLVGTPLPRRARCLAPGGP